jgi:hypothetical protein
MILSMDPGHDRIFKANSNSSSSKSREVLDVSQGGLCHNVTFNLKVCLAPYFFTHLKLLDKLHYRTISRTS